MRMGIYVGGCLAGAVGNQENAYARAAGAVLFQFSRKPQFMTAGIVGNVNEGVKNICSATLCESRCKVTTFFANKKA